VQEHAVCAMWRRLLHQIRRPGQAMKQVTVHTYRQDTYYPRVVRAVANILARSDVVAPVEVLMEMGNLTQKNHEAWSRGHVPYLERVCEGSLSKANRILRLIEFPRARLAHAPTTNGVPSVGSRQKPPLTVLEVGQ